MASVRHIWNRGLSQRAGVARAGWTEGALERVEAVGPSAAGSADRQVEPVGADIRRVGAPEGRVEEAGSGPVAAALGDLEVPVEGAGVGNHRAGVPGERIGVAGIPVAVEGAGLAGMVLAAGIPAGVEAMVDRVRVAVRPPGAASRAEGLSGTHFAYTEVAGPEDRAAVRTAAAGRVDPCHPRHRTVRPAVVARTHLERESPSGTGVPPPPCAPSSSLA